MHLKLPADESPSASSYKKELVNSNEKQRKGSSGVDVLQKASIPQRSLGATPPTDLGAAKPASRRVHFARTAKVKKVRSRQHYTPEERDGIWHTAEEYTEIKKRALATLKLLVYSSDFKENEEHTDRGLESRTKEAAQKRKEFKAYARELVFEEQENHKEAGVKSPGRLRKACLETSLTSVRQARENAKKDHEAVGHESLDDILAQLKLEYGWR